MKIKRFFNKIIKICQYIPILWQDEDWDFEYLLILLKYKLQRISNQIYKNNLIAHNEQRGIYIGINQTIDHINNYLDDIEAFEKIEGKLPFTLGFKTEKTNSGNYLLNWNMDENRPLNEEEELLYTQYITDSYAFQQKEWNAIFDTIKKEGQKWWD